VSSIAQKLINYENYLVFLIIPLFWLAILTTVEKELSYWTTYWWMFPISLLIATIVNTVGISGAALFVPFFILVFPFLSTPLLPEQSVKLGLITESFGLSSSALAFIRYGLVDRKLGAYTVAGAAPFVIGGAFLAFYIPKQMFNFIIATAMLISVYLLLHKGRRESKKLCIEHETIGEHHTHHKSDNATLVDRDGKEYKYCRCGYRPRFLGYGFGGIFQGMAGFGIGELGIVSMLITQIPIRIAIGTSHMIVSSTAILASLTHLSQSLVHHIETPWNILFMTVPAVIIGGQIAPYIAAKLRTSLLEHVVAGLFITLSLFLLYIGIIRG
jgi:uncharacterized membrane protein YfcA